MPSLSSTLLCHRQIKVDSPRSVERLVSNIHDGSIDEKRLLTEDKRLIAVLRNVDGSTTVSDQLVVICRQDLRTIFGPTGPLSTPSLVYVAKAMEPGTTPTDSAHQMLTSHLVPSSSFVKDARRRSMCEQDIDFGERGYGVLCYIVGVVRDWIEAIFAAAVREGPIAEFRLVG